MNDDGKKAEE
jgi:hypothetical protein